MKRLQLSMTQFEQKEVYQLLTEILDHEFMLNDPPIPYIQDHHQLMIADISSAVNAMLHQPYSFEARSFKDPSDNGEYKDMGSEHQRGSVQFFEKIGGNLEEFINILITNKNEIIIRDKPKLTLIDALKELMKNLYEDYMFIPKEPKELKDLKESGLITYITEKFELNVTFNSEEERNKAVGIIGLCQLPDNYIKKLKNREIFNKNKDRIQPAVYTNKKTSFYLPLCENFGELFFILEKQEKQIEFFSALKLKPNAQTLEDKVLGRVRYCDGLFTTYETEPGVYITKQSMFFQNKDINNIDTAYYRIAEGKVTQVNKMSKDEIRQKRIIAPGSEHQRQLANKLIDIEKQRAQSNLHKHLSSSNSSSSSQVSNQMAFMKPPKSIPSEIKLKDSLDLKGEDFSVAGINIRFPNTYQDFFSKIAQEYKLMIIQDQDQPTTSRIFFSPEICQTGMFGTFLNLFEFDETIYPKVDNLSLNVLMLVQSDMVLCNAFPRWTVYERQKNKDDIASQCFMFFEEIMASRPKLKPPKDVTSTSQVALSFG